MSLEGQQLGHYHLQRLIGSGSMGEVYLAEDSRLPRQVAIKVVRNEVSNYPQSGSVSDAARLFLREAKVIARLDHPHILSLYDYGEEMINGANITYLVMPYRPESSLGQWLALRGGSIMLSPDEALHIIEQAASALQYAHESGIIHQDVKPANFLLRQNRERPDRPDLLLGDFGVAKLSTGTSNASQSIRGTPTYMAPEQWNGEPVPATDQYALGVMAYELLTGRPPFQGPLMRMMYLHLHESPLPPSNVNPRLSAAVDSIILRALAKRPQDRFPSVAAFAQALRLAIQPTPSANGDLQATLAISSAEAQHGTQRTLTLPGGRHVTVNIPARVRDGQTLRLEGLGEQAAAGGPAGALLLRLIINHDRDNIVLPTQYDITKTVPVHEEPSSPPSGKFPVKAIVLIALVTLIALAGTGLYYAQARIPAAKSNSGATATSLAITATDQARRDPYPPNTGTLSFNDPLLNNSLGHNWDTTPTQYGTCTFTGNGFDAVAPTAYTFHACGENSSAFSNFVFEAQMVIRAGDCGGIIFRANFPSHHYYLYSICTNGYYEVRLYTQAGIEHSMLAYKFSSSINQGLGKTNLIAVVANGSSMTFYANHQPITIVDDTTYDQGNIGIEADSGIDPTEVVFTNVRVWAL